jgi:hypothetical protein
VSADLIENNNQAFQDLSNNLLGSPNKMSLFKLKPTGSTTSYYYTKKGGMY